MQTADERERLIAERYPAQTEAHMRELHDDLLSLSRKGAAWTQADQHAMDEIAGALMWIRNVRAGVISS